MIPLDKNHLNTKSTILVMGFFDSVARRNRHIGVFIIKLFIRISVPFRAHNLLKLVGMGCSNEDSIQLVVIGSRTCVLLIYMQMTVIDC